MFSLQYLLYLILILWIYWLWTRRKFYGLILKIGGPLGYPFIGMATQLIHRDAILNVIDKYSDKYGALMFSWLGPYPILVISEPDIVQEIFTSPYCVNKSILYKPVDEGTGKGLFGLKDPEWSFHRKHLNPGYSHKVLLSFMPKFNEEVNELLKTFEETMNQNESLDLINIVQDFTLNIAIKTTMGKSVTQDVGKINSNLLESYHCIVEHMTEMIFYPWLRIDLLRKLLGIYDPFIKAKTEIRLFIRELIEEKVKDADNRTLISSGSKNAFIDLAIDLMRRGIFSWQAVEDESNVTVVGAFETTATTITHVLIMLAMFPEFQQKTFEELLAIFPQAEDFEVTYDNLQDMVYMDMVINETMRLLTPVPIVARENTQDVLLSNGIVLPAGLQIAINIYRIHRRLDIWGPEAHNFNPDNFLPSNMSGKHPYAFIPFTKGIRNCIGWRYGLMVAKVTLAKLLRNYEFSTDFQYKDLVFVESIVLKLKNIPTLSFHKRKI